MKTIDQTFEEVKKIISEVLECDESIIQPDISLGDIGVTSLVSLEISVKIQGHFNIKITPEESEKLDTPRKIMNKIAHELK